MPIKQSAVKELRKTKKRTARNRSAKSNIKDALKKVTKALQSKDIVAARAAAQEAVKILDKAAAKNIIHDSKGKLSTEANNLFLLLSLFLALFL